MELPKISLPSSGGLLDDVKSRLGFGGQQQPSERRSSRVNDEFYDDGFDDYDGYDDGYDNGYDYYDDGYEANGYPDYVGAEPSSQYDRYNPVTTRTSAGVTPARLVSIDDVRANTHMPASLDRDPLPARRTNPASTSFRTLVNESTPAPNSPADVSRRRERSESLDDLFEPTTDAARSSRSGLGASPLASTAGSSFEPRAFSATSATKSRNVKVLHPLAYGDVEQVVRILRAGDAVVLAFDATPADLTKRLLDFSFGVACAMDATVDCLSPKVFFIAAGPALTEVERMHLRSQGVL